MIPGLFCFTDEEENLRFLPVKVTPEEWERDWREFWMSAKEDE